MPLWLDPRFHGLPIPHTVVGFEDFRAAVFFMAFLATVFFAGSFFRRRLPGTANPGYFLPRCWPGRRFVSRSFLYGLFSHSFLCGQFFRRRLPGTANPGYFLPRCWPGRRFVSRSFSLWPF